MNIFANTHPIILFLYYLFVFYVTIMFQHPIVILLSLICALLFFILLVPIREFFRDITYYLFVFLFIAIAIPRFNHRGETFLFFFNDLPITLEAVVFGLFIALKVVAFIFWFKTFLIVVSIDKIIYLFGNLSPKLAVFISTIVHFFSSFRRKLRQTSDSHKTIGLYTSNSIVERIISFSRVLSVVILSLIIEMLDRGDFMKARGYGIKKRTHFSLYRWKKGDRLRLTFILLLSFFISFLMLKDKFLFTYFPLLTSVSFNLVESMQFSLIFILFVIPVIVEVKENLHWTYLKSKI